MPEPLTSYYIHDGVSTETSVADSGVTTQEIEEAARIVDSLLAPGGPHFWAPIGAIGGELGGLEVALGMDGILDASARADVTAAVAHRYMDAADQVSASVGQTHLDRSVFGVRSHDGLQSMSVVLASEFPDPVIGACLFGSLVPQYRTKGDAEAVAAAADAERSRILRAAPCVATFRPVSAPEIQLATGMHRVWLAFATALLAL